MTGEMQGLLSDVDAALTTVTQARRATMLRKLTELLLHGASHYSKEHLSVFDAVMRRLTQNADQEALVELSEGLASIETAPAEVAACLSHHDDIAVAGPVLERCASLPDVVLLSVAKARSQHHLLAIAGRKQISVAVTDVLVDRGSSAVKLRAIGNKGAQFSEYGFARLVTDARTDARLAGLVKKRTDFPPELQPFLRTMAVA